MPPPKVMPLKGRAPLVKLSVPALTLVGPLQVLLPERVNVPEPTLISPPLPLMLPAKVVEALSPPVVRIAPLPSAMLLPATLFNSATVWLP